MSMTFHATFDHFYRFQMVPSLIVSIYLSSLRTLEGQAVKFFFIQFVKIVAFVFLITVRARTFWRNF